MWVIMNSFMSARRVNAWCDFCEPRSEHKDNNHKCGSFGKSNVCNHTHTHTQLIHPYHLWHVTLISWFPYTIHFLWVVIYWGGIFWKAGIVSCHNRSMGRREFEKNVALPVEAVFSKCVGRHCRRQTVCGGCHVGGITHFCVTAPAVYSRIKKNYTYVKGHPWSRGSSLRVQFVHGIWLAYVGKRAILLRELRCSMILRREQC